jgi:osmotically-inducible protein OsmY
MFADLPSDAKDHSKEGDALYDASQRIMESALDCLRHSSYPELWRITCQFYGGMLTLNGAVASFFLKQLAHAAVAGIKGVEEVANRLEVRYPANKSNDRGN